MKSWEAKAACRGLSPKEASTIFFGTEGEMEAVWTRGAKVICGGCPVREECLEAGLFEAFGVWGAMGPRERLMYRRARGLVKPSRTYWSLPMEPSLSDAAVAKRRQREKQRTG